MDGTTNKDYYKEPKEGTTSWFSPVIPQDAIVKEREKSTLFKFPNNSSLAGYTFDLPNSFFKEAENGEDGAIRLSLPGDLEVTAYKYGSDERVKVSAHQIFVEMQNSTPEQYKTSIGQTSKKKNNPKKRRMTIKKKVILDTFQ